MREIESVSDTQLTQWLIPSDWQNESLAGEWEIDWEYRGIKMQGIKWSNTRAALTESESKSETKTKSEANSPNTD